MERSGEFEDWYRELYPRVRTTMCVAAASSDEADEVTAEAFTRAAARWSRVRHMENRDGWAYTVALNQLRRRARRRTRERELVTMAANGAATRSTDASATVRFTELVASLPERMREVVVLRHVADLTEPTIADVLGISRGTVSSTLRDAHARLAERLAEQERQELR
ncbi:MAG: sigma-70 family RNA polymerase sigma factor [Actinomycetota bacterium]|nr:sigma-70 family RNA polymerase sigma factor [Actinomycetota bacterium]